MTLEERIEAELRELYLAYDNAEGYAANYPYDPEIGDERARIQAQIDILVQVLDLRLTPFAGFLRSIIATSCQQGERIDLYLPLQEWYTLRGPDTFAELVRAVTGPTFEAVYGGAHECGIGLCACHLLREPMVDEGDEEVAQMLMTERGLTIEQARASIYGW